MIVDTVVDGIKLMVWIIVTLCWAVVGFFFWVPFVARMIATFTAAIVVANFTGTSYGAAEHGLRNAITFYPRGFRHINGLLRQEAIEPSYPPMELGGVIRAAFEATYGLAFWALLLIAAVRYAGALPNSRIAGLLAEHSEPDSVLTKDITQAGQPGASPLVTTSSVGGAGRRRETGARSHHKAR